MRGKSEQEKDARRFHEVEAEHVELEESSLRVGGVLEILRSIIGWILLARFHTFLVLHQECL